MLKRRSRVIVTGGAGFIGKHLCCLLANYGHHVICIDDFSTSGDSAMPGGIEVVRHDVCDPIHIEAECIYHLACPASPVQYQWNPARTIETAVLGTRNMLKLARDIDARLLIASTSEVYGDPHVHPQPEEYWGHVNPTGVRSCYDEGKRCAEALAASWARQYGTDVRVARIFNTYGPWMDLNDGRVIPSFVKNIILNLPLGIYGDGMQTRSWCYVSDTVEALSRLMGCDHDPLRNPRVVNIGSAEEVTIIEVARRILALSGKDPDNALSYYWLPLPGDDPKRRCPDITKAKELLGWEPVVSLEDGLKRTLCGYATRLMGQAPSLSLRWAALEQETTDGT